ncbi:hypothetical protein G7Y89_g5322 [Cudoniella acicularis]|uniref:Uncharacterized protein n=1 Tax=Cudoniella acicularis TaxID=354080 RepID=A0A8H4W3W4_9HELO|nr:hypothetical protein G7Y89_g5322 [Cudoniella acicularis]
MDRIPADELEMRLKNMAERCPKLEQLTLVDGFITELWDIYHRFDRERSLVRIPTTTDTPNFHQLCREISPSMLGTQMLLEISSPGLVLRHNFQDMRHMDWKHEKNLPLNRVDTVHMGLPERRGFAFYNDLSGITCRHCGEFRWKGAAQVAAEEEKSEEAADS